MTCRGRSRLSVRAGGAAVASRASRRARRVAYLAWREHPDETEDVFPEGSYGCGADLAGAADLGVRYSHQVTDLPEAQAQTTQYDRHEVRCACGRVHLADAPPRAGPPGTVTYGLNVQVWCVFLMVMHHVPVERCADILESMSGTRPSDGWVHPARPCCPGGRRGERDDPGADHPGRRHLRGRDPAPRQAGPEDPQEVPAGRVHEPPDLLLPRRPGPGLLQGLRLQRPARHRGGARPVPELRRLRRHQPLGVGLSQVRRVLGAKSKQPPARLLLECLRHREADVLRFLSDTAIPPTSNQAERDQRPSKTQQKISGRLCSEKPPATVRHPRIRLHRRQARDRRLHRHPRRPRRKPPDAAHPGQRLNHARNPSRMATQELQTTRACLDGDGRSGPA